MDPQLVQEKGTPWPLSPQKKGHPMDSPNPPGRRSTLGTPNHLWTRDTPGSLCPQDLGHPKTSHYKYQRTPHAPQAPSTAPHLLSHLY